MPSDTSLHSQQSPVLEALDLEIDLAAASENGSSDQALTSRIESAVTAALQLGLSGPLPPTELFVQLVSDERSHTLNHDFRGKDKATNILSFPGVEPDDLPSALKQAAQGGPPVLLGDLIIATSVVEREAAAQNKTFGDHLSHLAVHGVLHLLGYDHIEESEAEQMETLECEILATLDIANPYTVEDDLLVSED